MSKRQKLAVVVTLLLVGGAFALSSTMTLTGGADERPASEVIEAWASRWKDSIPLPGRPLDLTRSSGDVRFDPPAARPAPGVRTVSVPKGAVVTLNASTLQPTGDKQVLRHALLSLDDAQAQVRVDFKSTGSEAGDAESLPMLVHGTEIRIIILESGGVLALDNREGAVHAKVRVEGRDRR